MVYYATIPGSILYQDKWTSSENFQQFIVEIVALSPFMFLLELSTIFKEKVLVCSIREDSEL